MKVIISIKFVLKIILELLKEYFILFIYVYILMFKSYSEYSRFKFFIKMNYDNISKFKLKDKMYIYFINNISILKFKFKS